MFSIPNEYIHLLKIDNECIFIMILLVKFLIALFVNTSSYQISIYLVNVQISFTFKWTRTNVVTYTCLPKQLNSVKVSSAND